MQVRDKLYIDGAWVPSTGKGTLEVNWTDSEHTKGVLHFAGTMHPRDTDIKIEWTAATTSAYKGPSCTPAPAAPPPGTP